MAAPLSTTDMANIRYYLGYSSRFFQVDSVLEQAMQSLNSDNDACNLMQALIASCQNQDALLASAQARLKLEQAEEVKYRGMQEIAGLRSEGRRFVGRMAAMLGVPVRHDAFSGGTSNNAPTWMSGMFGGGGGNTMKLG